MPAVNNILGTILNERPKGSTATDIQNISGNFLVQIEFSTFQFALVTTKVKGFIMSS